MAALYKPPTRVVTKEVPYQALVSEADPSFNHWKYNQVEYEFNNRYFTANPYIRGANNSYDNTYPVGQQYGAVDPRQVALSGFNLGGAATVGASSVSFTTTAAIPVGGLILLPIIDGAFGSILPANISDSAGNKYRAFPGYFLNGSGSPFTIAWAFAKTAMGAGATITYSSPNVSPLSSAVLCLLGVCIAGGIQNSPFDAAVTDFNAGSGPSPVVISGKPKFQSSILFAIAGNDGDRAFTQDGAHGWTGLLQVGNSSSGPGGTGAKAICSAFQTLGTFDPGSSLPVTFSPGQAASANWGAMIVAIAPVKPMYSGVATGSWA